jgi:hypothetical protein
VPVHVVVRWVGDDVGRKSGFDRWLRLVDLPRASGERELAGGKSGVDDDAAVGAGSCLVDVADVDLGVGRATARSLP